MKLCLTFVIFALLLFGCTQPARNDDSFTIPPKNKTLEKTAEAENKSLEITTQTGNQSADKTQENKTIEVKNETSVQTFDPKSFGSPNPHVKQPIPDKCCSHPYYHYVVRASSDNGLNWVEDNAVIRDHASVPDFFVLDDGTQMLYFVDGVYDTLGCMESTNGNNFVESECRIYNFTKEKIWDPTVVRISDSTYRLFFFSPEYDPNGMPSQQSKSRIYSAISKNGRDWLMESGVRYEDFGITDPSVIRINENKWYMFVSKGSDVIQSESSDGLTFVKKQELKFGGVPDVVEIEGKYYLFVCNLGIAYVSSEDAVNWGGLTNVIAPRGKEIICDPSVFKTSDGWKMYFKKQMLN